MIIREEYLRQLRSWKDEQVIKVITGIRRCGKSTLMEQFQDELIRSEVDSSQIISINFEELEYEKLLDYRKLYQYLKERLQPDKTTYIFLDEIQRVPDFEKVADSLYVKPGVDLYLTGSNSYLLSGDLATLLSGRYVEISMLPLSFQEFYEAVQGNPEAAFADYMRTGGFPYLTAMERTSEKVNSYLEGIYNTVIVRDIEERQTRKSKDQDRRGIGDIALLKRVSKYLASVIGSPVSTRNVTSYLTSAGQKVSPNTVDNIIDVLAESFIFYPAERFDVVGKQVLKTNKKFYMVDLGLRNHILPRQDYDLGFSLENIVFFELLRRGSQVNIGKVGTTEIDFVAQKEDSVTYFQVTADLKNKDTFEREMRPLRGIHDNYEKIILTLDRLTVGNYGGIRVINAIDWLLNIKETF